MLPATATRIDTVPGRIRAAGDTAQHPPATVTGAGATTSTVGAHGDSIPPAPPPVCVRDTLPTDITTRAIAVRDSLVRVLTDSEKPPYERQLATARIQSWWVPGCFGVGRAAFCVERASEALYALRSAL